MYHPVAGPSTLVGEKEKSQDAQMSAYLREEAANGVHDQHSPASNGSNALADNADRPPQSFMSSPGLMTTASNSPDHTIARADIRSSAEKILYTFLLPGAEREIILPDSITSEIIESIEERGRDDPEVFDAAKDYVFQAMERDAFPGFLRAKALGNLVPPSLMMRLIIGLLSLFAAFWAAFCLIFLNESRNTRVWVRHLTTDPPNMNLHVCSLSFPSRLAYTLSAPISTTSTPSLPLQVIASTRS